MEDRISTHSTALAENRVWEGETPRFVALGADASFTLTVKPASNCYVKEPLGGQIEALFVSS